MTSRLLCYIPQLHFMQPLKNVLVLIQTNVERKLPDRTLWKCLVNNSSESIMPMKIINENINYLPSSESSFSSEVAMSDIATMATATIATIMEIHLQLWASIPIPMFSENTTQIFAKNM